jgi:glucose-6-phosphate-specific signal transduction histidine kinase
MTQYGVSLVNLMALALTGFASYISYRRFILKRRHTEWAPTNVITAFLWALLAFSVDFMLQMAIPDRLVFHLVSLPVLLFAWLVVRFYYRVKVF